MLSAAMVGVNSVPSAQDTPSFSVNVTVEPWTFQSLASWDRMAPDSGSTATSASYPSWLIVKSALADDDCGSRFPGSLLSAIVKVAPSTYAAAPSPSELDPPSPQPARRTAVAQRPTAAVSFMGGFLCSSRWCGGCWIPSWIWSRSGPGAPDGAADVQVQRVAVAVVTDEGVRHVHAVVVLEVDQAVALVVDELLALRLLAELLEQAL